MILVCFWCGPLEAQVDGEVDWKQGTITVIGYGAPTEGMSKARAKILARRAATVSAYRDLLEMLKGVQVNSTTTVEDAMVSSDIIQTSVEGILKGARVVGEVTYDSDGVAQVTVSTRLNGPLLDQLLPKQGFSESEGEAVFEATFDASPNGLSGLIVDARGLGLTPALAPRVMDETRQLVYGAAVVNRDVAVEKGMVVYEKDLDAAMKNGRIGANPLIVKGLKSEGQRKTNVIVSTTDYERVRDTLDRSVLMACRVIFVVE